jgi:hypothetical protein
MARAFSARSRLYAAGTYGPFPVDGFTGDTTSALRWTMSVEGWPTDRTVKLMTVTMKWDNGDYSVTDIYGGPRNPRTNVALTEVSGTLYVPQEAGADGSPINTRVLGGDVSVRVFVPIKTAITLTALD